MPLSSFLFVSWEFEYVMRRLSVLWVDCNFALHFLIGLQDRLSLISDIFGPIQLSHEKLDVL